MTRDNFHCPRFIHSFDSLVPTDVTSSQQSNLFLIVWSPQLSLPVATSFELRHIVHVFQLLHNQHSVCTKMQALAEDVSDIYFQYIKFLSGTSHRCVSTVHKLMLNGVNMLCIYRWSGAFALMPTAGVNKTFVPRVNWLFSLGNLLYFCWNCHCTVTTGRISRAAHTRNSFSGLHNVSVYWWMLVCVLGRMQHRWLQCHTKFKSIEWIFCIKKKGKGKAIPLQAWTGPEGSSSLRLPDFKTIGTWRW